MLTLWSMATEVGPTHGGKNIEDSELYKRKQLIMKWFAKGDVDGSGNINLPEFQASHGR